MLGYDFKLEGTENPIFQRLKQRINGITFSILFYSFLCAFFFIGWVIKTKFSERTKVVNIGHRVRACVRASGGIYSFVFRFHWLSRMKYVWSWLNIIRCYGWLSIRGLSVDLRLSTLNGHCGDCGLVTAELWPITRGGWCSRNAFYRFT